MSKVSAKDTLQPLLDIPGGEPALSWRRLRALEALWDPQTQVVLSGLGIRRDWRCLELGAGTGTVARWLAYRCPDGGVTATEVDLRFLDGRGPASLTVKRHDAVEGEDLPVGSFDLIHARAVLCHLPDREQLVARAAGWLAPGGWLVVEDPAMFPADSSPHPVFRRWMHAHAATMARFLGSDLMWARSLPAVLARTGLLSVGMTAGVITVGDGGPGDEFWRVCFAEVGAEAVRAGLLKEIELDAARRCLEDPDFMDLSWALISAWARKA